MYPETHRNASDCTCAYCNKEESKTYNNNNNSDKNDKKGSSERNAFSVGKPKK